jgi:hypothetical protein
MSMMEDLLMLGVVGYGAYFAYEKGWLTPTPATTPTGSPTTSTPGSTIGTSTGSTPLSTISTPGTPSTPVATLQPSQSIQTQPVQSGPVYAPPAQGGGGSPVVTPVTPVTPIVQPSNPVVTAAPVIRVLFDVQQFNAPGVYPGDIWQVYISTNLPNSPVTMSGGPGGTKSVGTTDANGTLNLQGTFTAADAGTWTEQYYVGGIAAPQVVNYTVISPTKVSGYLNSTFQQNNPPGLYPGDSITVGIWDAPGNQPVTMSNGPGAGTLGSTNSAGNWSMTRTFTASDIGGWSEQYFVGGALIGSLQFTVSSPGSSNPVVESNPVGQLELSPEGAAGGTTYLVGGPWTLIVQGANPNVPVVVTGGPQGRQTLGMTDSGGNWSTSGTFQTSDIGEWNEVYTAGGIPLENGSRYFNVVAAPAPGTSGLAGRRGLAAGLVPPGTPATRPIIAPAIPPVSPLVSTLLQDRLNYLSWRQAVLSSFLHEGPAQPAPLPTCGGNIPAGQPCQPFTGPGPRPEGAGLSGSRFFAYGGWGA